MTAGNRLQLSRAAAALAAVLFAGAAAAADWKPADGPLMTRWAKDVDPAKPHPEYPGVSVKRFY